MLPACATEPGDMKRKRRLALNIRREAKINPKDMIHHGGLISVQTGPD